jgi:rhodanese-related sulfurtransferase
MSRKHPSKKQKPQKRSVHRRRSSISRGWLILGAVLVVALIAVAAIYFNSQSGSQPGASSATPSITVQQAYQKYQQGVFFLDVREQSEWDTFHIPNTTHIPLEELSNRLNELPRDQPIVVVCLTGHRSAQGRDILVNAGFTDVVSMTGGLTAWSSAGYPLDGTRP